MHGIKHLPLKNPHTGVKSQMSTNMPVMSCSWRQPGFWLRSFGNSQKYRSSIPTLPAGCLCLLHQCLNLLPPAPDQHIYSAHYRERSDCAPAATSLGCVQVMLRRQPCRDWLAAAIPWVVALALALELHGFVDPVSNLHVINSAASAAHPTEHVLPFEDLRCYSQNAWESPVAVSLILQGSGHCFGAKNP